jgi:dihydrofolate reductase
MGRLIYSAIGSVDGYIEDDQGRFEWAAPDDDVFAFVTEMERPIGTYLYGRRMYETMVYWETVDRDASPPAATLDFARMWRAASKVVFSRTLGSPLSERTRIERDFDPAAIDRLKSEAFTDLTIGGPELAAVALGAGLVDEIHLYLVPIAVGGGKRALPTGLRLPLELRDQHRFASGTVYLRYCLTA